MFFAISLKKMRNGKGVRDIYVDGEEGNDYYKQGKNLLIFKGDVYLRNPTNKELFDNIVQEGIDIVKKMKGEFFIIYYDDNSKKIYVANDKFGRETLFYFFDSKNLIFSDDFWEIINFVEPCASDIDIQSIKELAVSNFPLFHKTIIKNLEFFPPASIGEFSLLEGDFQIKQYWDYKYKPKNLDIDDAIERLDHLLDNAMKQIKEKNDSKKYYAIGLSGGLDSRLVAYYALKHDMKLKSFIIGERRPHKLLLSKDFSISRKLAKYFDLEHSEIEYNCESFKSKSFSDVRNYPMGPSQVFITIHNNLPEFDILLTGMFGGELLGRTFETVNINNLSNDEILDLIVKLFFRVSEPQYRFKKVLRLLKICDKTERNERKSIEGIITQDEFIEAKSKIRQFIEDESDKSNINILQKFLYFNNISRGKNNFFNSIHGEKKSYSIFFRPDVIEESLSWNPEFLLNTRLQNRFYLKKFPDLYKLGSQTFREPVFYYNKRFNLMRKMLALIEYIVRGRGLRYSDWAITASYRDYSKRILMEDNIIFNSIFDVQKITELKKGDIYVNLIKIKQILDLIETKGYNSYFEKRDYQKL